MRFTHTTPFCSVLSTLGLFAVSPAYSSIVRNDVDYQYFRDFAENKGAFAVGASNISIQDKQGKILGRVLNGIPMPDFRVSNRQTAIATLIHPQYVNSVKHNVGYGSIQFGNDTQNPEEQAYTYRLVSRNPHPDYDYHLPRLNKLVTEISPAALSSVPLLGNGQPKANAYLDTDRFPYFVRLGSGTQQVRKADGTRTRTAPAYQYLTGGTPLKVLGFQNHGLLVGGSLTDQPLNTYAIAGDSGSPLFAFDKHENRWVLAGVLSTYAGFDNFFNKYIVTQPEFIRSTIRQYETRLDVGLTTNELIWRDNGNGDSTLQGLNERITLPIANPSLAPQNDSRHMPSEDAGKTLILSSRFDNKTLMLADNINQGAGALQFDSNFTVVGKNHTWQGAGVIVADGKRVFWQVSNPKGDRLSKLGAGTLIANGQGINQGDISIGEGTVVLAQKAASDGSKQAFNQVGITSGRGTAVLADSQQIKPENLYFGFRGGRLDLNGNNLAFTHIRHADGGAQIVNHNPDQAATLTLTGNPVLSPEHVEWVQWGNRPQGNAAVYEYINPHRNRRTDYFILKPGGNPREFFPLNMENSTSWQFIGNNRQQAAKQVAQAENARPDLITFGGYLGENAQTGKAAPSYSKTNIEWVNGPNTPHKPSPYTNTPTRTGAGVPTITASKKAATPAPTSHGMPTAPKTGNFSDMTGEAAIEKTRHIANAAVYGRPEYRYNGALNLHYRPKRTDSTLLLNGGMNLNGEVLIEGGNMIVSGRPVPHAYDHQAKREPVLENEWTDGSFKAARFTLRNHARLTAGRNTAHLDGDITAYDLSGIVRKQNAPPLKLEGDSRGAFQIHVKNTGQEPQTTESLALVSLNPKHSHQARFTLQNGYADLGAYRYILRKNNNGYSLYNPLKEAELQIEATRAEHERNQQAYNQLQATDISRQVQHDSDATRQALQAWQNSQTELARIDSQVQYLSAQLKQTDPLTGILTRAQNLCAAQGYSVDICRQVAKAADTNDLTLFETELDTYIERVEMAESELDKARQGGDAQAVETARHAYLNALNRLSRQIHSLKTGVAGIRMPNLAELISRSANTAVSEQAAYNTGRQQAGRRIDRHLTDPQQQNIWLETGTQQTDYHSGTHRPYQQTTNYAHISIQTGITDRLSVGTILTDERTNNRFDEGVSARNRSNGAHLFVKGENGALFAAADLGYSNSRTRFTDYDGAAVRRHAWDAGINTGIKIDTGINLRPYAGIRINRSNGNRYVLDGAEINSPAQIQTTWHAGIRLDKTVELGQAKLTPAFSSDYYDTRQNSGSALSVNDRTLLQQAAHGTLHTLQIDAGYKGWNAKLHAAYGKDSNTARHKQAGIKIGYNW